MKSAYVPDLTSLQLLGDLNYRRITKLIRTQEMSGEWHFIVPSNGSQESILSLVELEKSPYTTQLSFTFGQRKAADLLFDHSVKMTVRMYHDMKIAEITKGHRQYKGSYPYPNESMYHRDEKIRLNQQLADLLELCLKHGHRHNQQSFFHPA
ncbi:DUF1249 domain-containing protein [Marinomonas agarivorans]|nr:DUF1249 domain-containing protein [Marinomonas agarivorans]